MEVGEDGKHLHLFSEAIGMTSFPPIHLMDIQTFTQPAVCCVAAKICIFTLQDDPFYHVSI